MIVLQGAFFSDNFNRTGVVEEQQSACNVEEIRLH